MSKYPFIISNTKRSDKSETHWWNILDLHLKKEILLLNSFSLSGLKNFILQDDKKLINKTLFGLEKFKLINGKSTLLKTTFSRLNSKHLQKKSWENHANQ